MIKEFLSIEYQELVCELELVDITHVSPSCCGG